MPDSGVVWCVVVWCGVLCCGVCVVCSVVCIVCCGVYSVVWCCVCVYFREIEPTPSSRTSCWEKDGGRVLFRGGAASLGGDIGGPNSDPRAFWGSFL